MLCNQCEESLWSPANNKSHISTFVALLLTSLTFFLPTQSEAPPTPSKETEHVFSPVRRKCSSLLLFFCVCAVTDVLCVCYLLFHILCRLTSVCFLKYSLRTYISTVLIQSTDHLYNTHTSNLGSSDSCSRTL